MKRYSVVIQIHKFRIPKLEIWKSRQYGVHTHNSSHQGELCSSGYFRAASEHNHLGYAIS